jgi:hypothetical protein
MSAMAASCDHACKSGKYIYPHAICNGRESHPEDNGRDLPGMRRRGTFALGPHRAWGR